jgi:uncharacterized membrane protein
MTEPKPSNSALPDAEIHLQHLLDQNLQIKALLNAQADAGRSNLHRPIERLAGLLRQPSFIISALVLFLLWMAVNTELLLSGRNPWDEPPFFWLQGLIGALSLIVTSTVLVSQARQNELAEQRADLQLQVTLLTEQRTAKLIQLLQELRQDMPGVHNKRDEQAEVMQQASNPLAILEGLDIGTGAASPLPTPNKGNTSAS